VSINKAELISLLEILSSSKQNTVLWAARDISNLSHPQPAAAFPTASVPNLAA